MKTKKPKTVKTGRVTSIGISRLWNTGNYTNVRYDLTCEVPNGASAKATMAVMISILKATEPVSVPSCLPSLRSARKKKLTERSEYEKANMAGWMEQEEEYKRDKQRQNDALEELDRLGGVGIYKDAKLNWEYHDYDDTPF